MSCLWLFQQFKWKSKFEYNVPLNLRWERLFSSFKIHHHIGFLIIGGLRKSFEFWVLINFNIYWIISLSFSMKFFKVLLYTAANQLHPGGQEPWVKEFLFFESLNFSSIFGLSSRHNAFYTDEKGTFHHQHDR